MDIFDYTNDPEFKERIINARNKQAEIDELTGKKKKPQEDVAWITRDNYKYHKETRTDNITATIIYVIILAVTSIFKGNVFFWTVATIVWWRHINRYERMRKQKEQDALDNGDIRLATYLASQKISRDGLCQTALLSLIPMVYLFLIFIAVIPINIFTAVLAFIAGVWIVTCISFLKEDLK